MDDKQKKNQKKFLGRGLDALLDNASYFRDRATIGPVFEILIDKIKTNPFQPRKAFNQESLNNLSKSIKGLNLFGLIKIALKVN